VPEIHVSVLGAHEFCIPSQPLAGFPKAPDAPVMPSHRKEAEDEDHQADTKALREAEQLKWHSFRLGFPSRFSTRKLPRWMFGRPQQKDQQTNWTVYTDRVQNKPSKIHQQHLLVPLFVTHSQKGPTQPLAGLVETAPMQGREADKEHVTNIWRMEALLDEHPEVDFVERDHKTYKYF